MDPTEDLSARVLLKHILSTDPPRTPITRSASSPRRSSRLGEKDAGAKTPQDLLRHSLRKKLRESITRKSLPATKRRTASVVLRKSNTPAPTSMLFDDGDTPRHILMNILRTDPVRSPVVHEKAASEETQPASANSSISSKRSSIEISGLDLPDITIGNAVSTVKGLSRKRPRRSLNVTAFEKRLKDGDGDIAEESEESVDDHSSLSLSSSTSLSLKTPFGDGRTEKRGLQRRVSNRRRITEEEFGAAVDKRQMGEVKSFAMPERGLSDTTYSEGFTLGLSKLTEPDITADIVHCDTALYAQPEAMTSNFSMVATQDKQTVMASQLQRQLEVEQEELMEAEQSGYLFPTEEEPQNEECFSQSDEDVDAAESKTEERKSTAGGQPEDSAAKSQNRLTDEEKENTMGAQTEEESVTDSQAEEDAATRPRSEDEEGTADSQNEEEEEEGGVDSQIEDVAAKSEGEEEDEEEEEGGVDSQVEDVAAMSEGEEEEEEEEEEEGGVDSQVEDVAAMSEGEEEDEEEEGAVAEYQSDQEDPAEGGLTDSQPEDVHDDEEVEVEEEDDEQASGNLERSLEHISRRTHLSEGGVMPLLKAQGDTADTTEAGWSEKSKAHGATDLHSSLEMGGLESSQPHTGIPDLTEGEPEADKENSFHPSIEDGEHQDDSPPEEAAAEDPAEQEEEWEEEDEESEEVPSKTPAFVREKRNMFYSDPLASPSLLKNSAASNRNEDLPAAKPKQVRKRAGPAKQEAGLPKSYLMNVFKHFAKTKVSSDVYPVLKETMDKFFERMAEDLETYAHHAKRKTIEVEDAELLLKRQGYVNDKVPVEVLIEKYLRMDQRKLLIPIATSGNIVIPKRRR